MAFYLTLCDITWEYTQNVFEKYIPKEKLVTKIRKSYASLLWEFITSK